MLSADLMRQELMEGSMSVRSWSLRLITTGLSSASLVVGMVWPSTTASTSGLLYRSTCWQPKFSRQSAALSVARMQFRYGLSAMAPPDIARRRVSPAGFGRRGGRVMHAPRSRSRCAVCRPAPRASSAHRSSAKGVESGRWRSLPPHDHAHLKQYT